MTAEIRARRRMQILGRSLPAFLLVVVFQGLLFLGAGVAVCQSAASKNPTSATPDVAVGAQYGSTHVYVTPEDLGHFVSSVVTTFGGTASKRVVTKVTPTSSSTLSQFILTPVGTFSVFGYETPITYPFGTERTGYLVTDINDAVRAARLAGAEVIVAAFNDPIGQDAIIQFPGGVNTQLYVHTSAPFSKALETVPENRIYLSPDGADAFIRSFLVFSHGKVLSDDRQAAGVEIGRPMDTYRRVRIESKFGKMTILVTDGHLPYPYGREMTGYEVDSLADTLGKATSAGVRILVAPYQTSERRAAMVQFPGSYIAEIHSRNKK